MIHPEPIQFSLVASSPESKTVAAAQCAALLFAEALKPLATALGFYGEAVVSAAAQAAARSERGGLRGVFERAFTSDTP
jgi:hypothetical protein